ncbi:MAG: hypothetical protein JNK47_15045 [Mesorhizobium sp.]|nr:hypothetical protein [Mesorhizobium sp.]MBL8578540.1 hypothetical protein [Mesorhizobium sp.]
MRVVLPTVAKPFVLITTDGDTSVPSEIRIETVKALKANANLIGWYTQNCDGTDPDIQPFPIGLDLHTPRGWTTPQGLVRLMQTIRQNALPVEDRPPRIFSDLGLTPSDERRRLMEVLDGCSHVDFATRRVSQAQIWKAYAKYPLVLSAHGNGLDCHRTWELLALGSIVVTKTSSLDPLYAGLPVVILNDWEEARDLQGMVECVTRLAPLTRAPSTFARLNTTAWIKPLRDRI